MAIDRNPNAESEKPATGKTNDAAVDGADSNGSQIQSFLQKLGDASAPVAPTQEIKVAAVGDLTGIIPVVEVNPNLLETQPGVLGDHKTGPTDSLPVDLHPVEFVQTHLSPDAIARNADLVFQALSKKTQQYRSSTATPDLEAVKNILQNMEEVDRHQLEQVFEQKYGTTLRQAFRKYLAPGEGLATVDAILLSKNGETNLAGNAQIALTVLDTDPVRGLRMLRGVLGTLNSTQTEALKTKFQTDYGIPLETAIANAKALNPAQKEVLTGLLAGVATMSPADLKVLAEKAVAAKDLGLLSTVIGDNQAVRALLNTPEFQNAVLEAFGTPKNRRNNAQITPNPIATDILREGRISLATILKADTGTLLHFLDNPQNTDYVFTHATPKDQRDYIKGRYLVENNLQPTNDADAEAKRVYLVLEEAIKSRAEGPRQAILREQLLFGGKFLSSDLASMVSDRYLLGLFGGNYNVSDMLVHVEKNLTEQEFNLLRNPFYKDEFARSLQSFLKPDEAQKVMSLVEAKIKAPDFESSKTVLRPLEKFIADYNAAGSTNIKQFIERIEAMSPDEAARYRSDPAFRKTIDDFGDLLIARGDSQAENAIPLIKSLLGQVGQTGKPPVLNELDKLIKEWGFVNDDRFQGMSEAAIQAKKFQTIAQVELILKDPKYMEVLTSIFKRQTRQIPGEVSREEEALTRSLGNILWQCGAGTNAFNSLMVEGNTTVGMAGRVPFDGTTVADKALTYSVIATLPKEQLDNWRYSLLFDYQKAILENVLKQNGTLTMADKMRVLVTQGGKLTDLSQDFATMSDAAFKQLEQEYFDKYKTDLKTDLRNTLPQRERMTSEQIAMFETILGQNCKVLPIDRMRMLVNGNGGKFSEYQSFFSELPAGEWPKLQADYLAKYGVALNDAILASLTKNENLDRNHQILIKHILDEGNGIPQPIDKLRAFILGDGGKFSDFKQMLHDLPLDQRQKLHDDYVRIFGSNFDNDFLNKVDKAYKIEYMLLLSVTPKDGLNEFFQRMSQYAPMTVADGSDLSLQRMLQINEQVARQFNSTFQNIPKPVQEALAEYFSTSMQNALDSNKKYAEFVTNVIMTAASVAAFIAFLPAGVSLTLGRLITQEMARKLVVMAALSTSGAVGRPAIMASIEGANFDSSPQALLMSGSLGALEMLLSYPFGMGVLATKTTVALTATQATERVTNVMSKIAALSGNPNDPALAAVRAEAYKTVTEIGNFSDRKQMEEWRDQIFGALIAKNDGNTKDLVAMAATITAVANEQTSHQIAEVLSKINAISPDNANALAAARVDGWNALSAKAGMSADTIAQARTEMLQALAAKQDPVAIAALKALDSVESLSKVSGAELADRLKERIFQSIQSADSGAAQAIVQVQQQANQALTNLLIQKIDTQAATIAGSDLQALKTQALDALNSLSTISNSPEIASLRNQLIEALAKANDPAAKAALEITSLIERETNKTLDFSALANFNQKMQQDPAALDGALSLLQKQKSDIDQLSAKLITDATTMPANLTTQELSTRALNATEQLNTIVQPSAEVVQALKKQGTDAINALATQGADKAKLELDFYHSLVRHDASATATLNALEQTASHNATVKQVENLIISVQNSSGNLTQLKALRTQALEALTRLGDSPEALAMRARVLTALDRSQDPVAKVALEAFESVKGLSNESELSRQIMVSLARGSEEELQLIKLGALKNRIADASDNVQALRQQALTVINTLPESSRGLERLELLRSLKDKDPLSKSALEAIESLGEQADANLSRSIVEALERGDIDGVKSAHISALRQKILSASGDPSETISQALNLISSLSNSSSQARIDFLKAIEGKVVLAKPARQALERASGLVNETEITSQIMRAFSTDNAEELGRIQVNSIIATINKGTPDLNSIRQELLDTILTLPNKEQQPLRLLGMQALAAQGDGVAIKALAINDIFTKASENSLDLLTFAKFRQSLPQDIDAELSVFGRNVSQLNSLTNSIASSSLEKLNALDARALTDHLTSLTEQIASSAADKEMVSALTKELSNSLQILTSKISQLESGSFELSIVRERALASLETLKSSASNQELVALRTNILTALAEKGDSVSKAALQVKYLFDKIAIEPESLAAIQQLDSSLRAEVLNILGRSKQEFDQAVKDSLERLSTVGQDLTIEQSMSLMDKAVADLQRMAFDASNPVAQSLRQKISASVDVIVSDIERGASIVGDKRKEAFQLLDSLSEHGFSGAQEAALRAKILDALAAKNDPTAKAAIAALDAVRGMPDEVARTTNILSALAKDSSSDLRQIQIASIQDKILSGSGDITVLRKQALDAISQLPESIQATEKIKLLTAIKDKDPVAKTALSVQNYLDNAANLSVDDLAIIEKMDPTLRSDALSVLGRTQQEFDQIVKDSLERLSTVGQDLTIEQSMSLMDKAVADLQRMAFDASDPVAQSLRQKISASVDVIVSDIERGASIIGDKRKEAFQLLDSLSEHGFSDAQEAALRAKILDALAAKNDPTAKAAIAALDAVRGMPDEVARTTNILSALAKDSSSDLRQIQIASIQDKILTGSGDVTVLRKQALDAISQLPESIQAPEKIKLLTAIKDKDPVAKTALSVQNYLDNAANLSVDDLAIIEKMDPTLRSDALSVLGRTQQEFDQIVKDSLRRISSVRADMPIDEAMNVINTAVADLQRLAAEASDPLRESLRQQVTSSVDVIVSDIERGASIVGDKRKEAFLLLDKLSEHGFSDAQEAALRAKILDALAAKNDPTAKAAIAALDSVRGMPDEVARTTNILSALAKDSSSELRQIQIASIQDKILTGSGDITVLRKQALDAVSQLPADIQQAERMKLLTAIKDKDPVAKTALLVQNYLDNAANLSVDDLALIEKMDPIYRNEALSVLGRTKQEFDQVVLNTYTRIGALKPDLAIGDYLTGINASIEDLKRLSGTSEALQDLIKQKINSSIDAITNNIQRNAVFLLKEKRSEVFSLLDSLSKQGFSESEVTAFRGKVLQALASQNDPTAKAAIAALDAVRGMPDEVARTTNILSALAKDSSSELRQIQIASIQDKILTGSGDVSVLRKEALDAISQFPADIQQAERLKLLTAIKDKDPVASTFLNLKSLLDNAANLSVNDLAELEKLDPAIRSQALEILGRSTDDFNRLISETYLRLETISPTLSLDEAVSKVTTALGDLSRLSDASPALRDSLKKQITSVIESLTNNLKTSSTALLPENRKQLFQLLEKLNEQGFDKSQVMAFRADIVQALAAKEDPVALAAVKALDAMRGLPDETARYSNFVAALLKDSTSELQQLQISSIEAKILSGSGDINSLRQEGLKAISQISEEAQPAELVRFLNAIKDKDPIAKSALNIKNYFDNAANLSAEDLAVLEKMDPGIKTQALAILGRSEEELGSIAKATVTRLQEALKQRTLESVESTIINIENAANITGIKRDEVFQLLNNLTDKGLTQAQESGLRMRILNALAQKEDPTAKAALKAFESLHGLDEQAIGSRTTEIIAALAKDSKTELEQITVSVLQSKILTSGSDINVLRKTALETISQLPEEIRQAEKLKFLTAIAETDPVAKSALTVNSYLSDLSSLTFNKIAAIENLPPALRSEVLSILGRNQKELDQIISDSLSRLAVAEPELPASGAVNNLILTFDEWGQIASTNSPGLRNAWRQRITSSIDAVVKEIQSGSELLGEQRMRAFELINSLPNHGFTQSQTELLRNKIIDVLIAKDDPAAKLALSALRTAKGLEDEVTISGNIITALTKGNLNELRQIEISSIQSHIIANSGDLTALRSQALEIIKQLPEKVQAAQRIKFLTAISETDPFAKSAIAVDELLSKELDSSFDLISLARMRLDIKPENIDSILAALTRNKSELDALTTKLATDFSHSLENLDIAGLTNRLKALGNELSASAADREIATVLKKQAVETIETLSKRILELPTSYTDAAALKDQLQQVMQALKLNTSRLEYTRLENILNQSFVRFDKTVVAHIAETNTSAAIAKMNAAIDQIKSFNGKDFVAVRQRGLTALKEMEGLVDGPTLVKARKDLLDALALKQDRFAVNILKRDALRERIANGDFDALATLERDMKRSLDSGVTNEEAHAFLKAESDAIADLKLKITRMKTANSALEKLTVTSDQAAIEAARKEATEALAAMKPHLNESTLAKLQAQLDQKLARFEKPVIPEAVTTSEIKPVEVKTVAAEVVDTPATQRLSELTLSIKNFKGNAKQLTALRTEVLKTLEEAEKIVDAATLNRMRKEVYEALAAQKDDFAVKALRRMALKEEAEKGKLNPLARMEQDLTKEIERIQARVAQLQKRTGAELELAAEERVLQTLQKEQTAAAAMRTTLEAKVIPLAVAASVARASARELYAPNPEQPVKEVPLNLVPSAALMELARVRLGEGPWQSAERILATDGKPHTVAEVRALTRAIQATYLLDNGSSDMSGLPVNYFFITPDNYGALINAVKDDKIKYLLLGLAN